MNLHLYFNSIDGGKSSYPHSHDLVYLPFIFILAVFLMLAGCSSHHEEIELLDKAEKEMGQYPDSAKRTLEQLNSGRIKKLNPDMYARYCLLYSQALDKNYIDVTDDSIIKAAVSYYEEQEDNANLMVSYYYLSRVQQNNKDYAQSIVSCYKAENLAKRLGDFHYLGLVYREMADLFNVSFNRDKEVMYRKLSVELFERGKDVSYINDALLDLGWAYYNSHKYSLSAYVAHSLIAKSEQNRDSVLYGDAIRLYAGSLIGLGKYEKAKDILFSLGKMSQEGLNADDLTYIAYCYYYLNKVDSARIVEKFIGTDKMRSRSDLWFINYKICKSQSDYKSALELSEKFMEYQDSTLKMVLSRSVQNSLDDYVIMEKEQDEVRNQRRHIFLICVSVVTVIVSALIVMLLRVKWRNKYLEMERNITAAQSLKSALLLRERQLADMSVSINELFKQKFETIDNLCSIYYESKNSPHTKNRIYEEVVTIINGLQADSHSQQQLEDIVNRYRDSIMIRLKRNFPKLKEPDYLLFLYIAAGFSQRAISVFLQ